MATEYAAVLDPAHYADLNAAIASDLYQNGWSVQRGYFDPVLIHALHSDLVAQDAAGNLTPAGVGRGDNHMIEKTIRNDDTQWLVGIDPAPRAYLAVMEGLRRDLNRHLFMGLFDFEAHYARYKTGGFYKKHLDALKGAQNRLVSTVTYLTPDWTPADEGFLVLYKTDDAGIDHEIIKVLPEAGTLALFLSEDIPHEVLPPKRPRASIAGWFRCNESVNGQIRPHHVPGVA